MKCFFLLCVYCLFFRSYDFLLPSAPVKCVSSDVAAFENIFKPICGAKGEIESVLDCLIDSGIFSKDSLVPCAIKSIQDVFKELCDGNVKFKDNYCCLLTEALKLNLGLADPVKRLKLFKECLPSVEDSCKQQIKDLKKAISPKCDALSKNGEYPLQLMQCFKNNRLLEHEQIVHTTYIQPYEFFREICKDESFEENIYCESIKADFYSSAHKTADVKVVLNKCMAEKKLPPIDVCTQLLHDIREAIEPKCVELLKNGQYVIALKKCFTDKGLTVNQEGCESGTKFTPYGFFGSLCIKYEKAHYLYCCTAKKDFASSKEIPADAKKIVNECLKQTVDPCIKQLKDFENTISPKCKQLSKDGKYPEDLFKCFTKNGLMKNLKKCQKSTLKPYQVFEGICEHKTLISDMLCCSAPKDFSSLSSEELTAKVKEIVHKCVETVKE